MQVAAQSPAFEKSILNPVHSQLASCRIDPVTAERTFTQEDHG
jgi:hypothetical protein